MCIRDSIFRVFDSLNWVPGMSIAMDEVLKQNKFCEATICYTGDIMDKTRTRYTLDYYVKLAKELEHIGIISASDVRDAVRVRVKKAYPAYFGTYAEFDKVRAYLDTFDNLYCIGRNGQHKYNNICLLYTSSVLTSESTSKPQLQPYCKNI